MSFSRLTNLNFSNRSEGFTLIELLVALAVLAIISVIAFNSYNRYIDRANNTTAISDIKDIDLAIERFRALNNLQLPNSLVTIGKSGMKDPWGNPYRYLNISTVKGKGALRKDRSLVPINSDYDLYSMGKDGKSRAPLTAKVSHDDIIRANNGGFIGLAEDY